MFVLDHSAPDNHLLLLLLGALEKTHRTVFSGPAAVLLLNGNSEWHSGDAPGISEFLPAVMFIITVKSYLLSGWAFSECSPIGPHFELNLDTCVNPKTHFFPAKMEKL